MTGLDYAILVFLALGAIRGWLRGLLVLVTDLAGSFLAFYLAAKYSGPLVGAIDRATGLVTSTAKTLSAKFPASLPAMAAPIPKAGGLNLQAVGALDLPEPVKKWVLSGATDLLSGPLPAGSQTVGDLISYQLAITLWMAALFLVGGLLLGKALTLIGEVASRALDLTPLLLFNRTGGAALGAAQAALLAAVLTALALPIINLGQPWPPLANSKLVPLLSSTLWSLAGWLLSKVS